MTASARFAPILLASLLVGCAEYSDPPTIVEGSLGERVFDRPHAIYSIRKADLAWEDDTVIVLISNDPDACFNLTRPGMFERSVISDGCGGTIPSLALQMPRSSTWHRQGCESDCHEQTLLATYDPGTGDRESMEMVDACGGEAFLDEAEDPGSAADASGTFNVSFGKRGDARGTFHAEYCEELTAAGCSAAGGGLALGVLPLVLLALRRRRFA